MKKNNQPLIIGGIVVIGAVLIIALALIFTRGDSETEAPAEDTVSENGENATNENGENGGEQTTPQPDPQPTPQPAPDPAPDPQPTLAPNPQPGVLPADWDSLTPREKTDLDPFDCDHATQWVSAEDGSCIDKPSVDNPVSSSGTPAYSRLMRNGATVKCIESGCSIDLAVEPCLTNDQIYSILQDFEDYLPSQDALTVSFYAEAGIEDVGDYWDLDNYVNPCPDPANPNDTRSYHLGTYTRTTAFYHDISGSHPCDDMVPGNRLGLECEHFRAVVKGKPTEAQLDELWQQYLPEEEKDQYALYVLTIHEYKGEHDSSWWREDNSSYIYRGSEPLKVYSYTKT